jgi:hypothetical protein
LKRRRGSPVTCTGTTVAASVASVGAVVARAVVAGAVRVRQDARTNAGESLLRT